MLRPILTVLVLAMIVGIVALATSGTKEEAPDASVSGGGSASRTAGLPPTEKGAVVAEPEAGAEPKDPVQQGTRPSAPGASRADEGGGLHVVPQPFSPDADPILAGMLEGLSLERIEEGELWVVSRSGEGQRALAVALRMPEEQDAVFESFNQAVEAYWLDRLRTRGRDTALRELRVSTIQRIDPATRTFVPLTLPR